ncbi:hypothetical protein FSP39_008657 [Pinctada imbricata]|uniref:VWFD domain-containing protein n=1 Tax=Pinctada imbricata TaxID=66713 RepID=A0AA89CA86_PINIB|nr:hypothetical protein FSP39_008657 [Pinctada imbricata]
MTDLVATNNYCGLLTSTSGPFKQCIADDPELASEYFESCKVDVCENEGEPSLETIKCQTFQGYAEDCKEEGFHVKWRTSRFCPGKCDDPNMEYKESGQRCTPTCVDQNMNNDSCSDEGISGCFCKDGFVLSDMKCVQKSECGCRDVKGQYYPIGHIKKSSSCVPSEECRRVNGRSVFVKLSSSKSCHSMAKCQLNTKGEEACVCGVGFYGDGYNCSGPCRCTGYGDPHYKTYDGQIIDFMGTCQYTLTKSTTDNDTCAFNVEVKNEHRGSNTAVSYTKYVEVDTFSVRATLKKNGKVLVRYLKKNKEMYLFAYQNSFCSVETKER